MPTCRYVRRSTNVVAELDESLLHDLPGAASVVSLKVADILENHISRRMFLENLDDLVKERAPRTVSTAVLRPRFREGLARKPSAENVMLGDLGLELANIPVHNLLRLGEVLLI